MLQNRKVNNLLQIQSIFNHICNHFFYLTFLPICIYAIFLNDDDEGQVRDECVSKYRNINNKT